MVTYYCPYCWETIPAGTRACPACGAPLEEDSRDIIAKYIAALSHPQAETRLRAAWILGQMRAARAIESLVEVVTARGYGDPYLLAAAAESLGQIGGDEAEKALVALSADSTASVVGRVAALRALECLWSKR